MSINCPLKTSVLYKELQVITNNNELVSNHMYGVITQLQDQGLLSKHRFKTESGEWVYTIPKLTKTEKAIAESLKAGTVKGEKNTSKATELDKYLTIKEIDWIKVAEKDNAYFVTIVEPDLSKPLSADESIDLLEELEGILTEEEINQALLDYQDQREILVQPVQQAGVTIQQRGFGRQLDLFSDVLTEEEIQEAFINETEQEKVLTSEFVAQVAEKLLNQLNLSSSVINFVSTEEAIELTKDSVNPYTNQPAFYFNGNIYFVNGQMTFTTSVHEISHIFIKSIRYQNPELFETLYNDLKAIPEMAGMLEEIKEELATTEVTGDVKEEAIVRFFTEIVKNDIAENPDALDTNFSNSKEKKSLLQKILYAIKKLIRSAFGKGVTIEKLNKNTTLKELSELLISEGFSVNMETVSKSDVVNYINNKQAFEEDIRNQLQGKFKEGDSRLVKVLFETVNESSRIYQNTLLEIKNNNDLNALQRVFQEGYDEYMRITGTKNITQRTKAETINLIINKELEETVEFAKVATDLQQIFATQESLIKNMSERVKFLKNNQSIINDQDYLREVTIYQKHLKGLSTFTEKLLNDAEELEFDINNDFIKELGAFQKTVEQLQNRITKALVKVVSPVLTERHNNSTALERSKKEEEIKKFEEQLKNATSESAKSVIEGKIKDLKRVMDLLEITPEIMEDYINGKRGDITYLETFIEEYVAQQDPSIASFAMYVKSRISDAHVQEQERYIELRNTLDDLENQAGLDPGNIEQYANEFLFTDIVDMLNDKSEFVPYEVYALLNPYKNKYNTRTKLQNEITKLTEEYDQEPTTENREKLIAARKKLTMHNAVFFHNENVIDYYFIDTQLLNNPEVNGAELLQQVDEHYSTIRAIKEQSKLAQSSEEKADLYEEAKQARFALNELYSNYQNGKLKTKQGLKDAEALRKHRDLKRNYHEYTINRGDFEDAYAGQESLFRVYHSTIDGLLGKELEEAVTNSMKEWLHQNTRVVVKDSFYEKKKNLYSQIADVSKKIEESMQQNRFLSQMINSTVAYNDKIYTLTYNESSKEYILKSKDEEINLGENPRDTPLADLNLKVPTKELNLAKKTRLFESLLGKKDDNNEYYASELSEEHMGEIKKIEEEIEADKNSIIQLNGLTTDENQELSSYYQKYKNKEKLTSKENTRKQLLESKKAAFAPDPFLKGLLKKHLAQLAALQSTEASTHYTNEVENLFYDFLKEELLFTGDTITFTIAEEILNPELAETLMAKNAKYKEWFEKNHYLANVYNQNTQEYEEKYQRLTPWNKTKPTDPADYETFTFTNPEGVDITIDGAPSIDFYSRRVKDEFKTGYDPVTKTIKDSEFRSPVTQSFRPRNLEEIKALKESNPEYFTDLEHEWDHYVNYDYYKLKERDPIKFKILETIRKYHHESQKNLDAHDTLEDLLPRYRNDLYENLTAKDRESLGDRAKGVFEKVASKFRMRPDDYENFTNYTNHLNAHQKTIYKTDQQQIPITGKYILDKDQVSRDIFKSLGSYAVSAAENRVLQQTSTIARTLQAIANKNTPADKTIDTSGFLKKTSRWTKQKMMSIVSSKEVIRTGEENRRSTLINAMVETLYEGKQFVGGKGMATFVKALQPFTALASHSFFAFDLHSAAKNYIGARSMIGLQALNSNYFSYKSFWLSYPRATKAMWTLSSDVYSNGVQKLDTQIINQFDGFQGRFKEKFGSSPGRTLTRDFVNMSWFTSTRQFLEIQTNVETLFAMLQHVKLERTTSTGEIEIISYLDAWELDSTTKKLKLKDGIDSKYAPGGSEFTKIKLAAQEHNAFAQGVYSDFDKTILERTPFGAMTVRMKKFFVKMALDRFAFTYDGSLLDPKERINLPTGKSYMGFHIRTLRTLAQAVRTKGSSLMYMTSDEKKAFIRTLIDLFKAQLLWKTIILGIALGFDDEDEEEDKSYSSMRERSGALPTPFTDEDYSENFNWGGWIHNNLILSALYAEDEISFFTRPTTIIKTGLGWQPVSESFSIGETINLATDLGKYTLFQLGMEGMEPDAYDKSTGALTSKQAGEYKFWYRLQKLAGLKGKLMDPETAARNFRKAVKNQAR